MNVEIITIGDEILIGQIVDSNSAYIGKLLTEIGAEVKRILSIKDEKEEILNALEAASKRADLVLITGGLGPTKDDLTKKTLLEFFDDELVENQEALDRVKMIFSRYERPLLKENIAQAWLPSKAEALINKRGTAPGMWFEQEKVIYVSLPGVPVEMKYLMKEEVLPRLVKQYKLPSITQKTILTSGLGESFLADKISDIEDALPKNMSLAYLPGPGRVRLRLMARGENKKALNVELEHWVNKIKERIKENYSGIEGESSLLDDIATRLNKDGKTLSLVESFTGGKIMGIFTEIPGTSAYFKGGVVPYQTNMKVHLLGVSQTIIDKHSVVSAAVAKEMALKGQELLKSDYCLSTTGNAGPTKGDSDAEIGTAFIGLATPEKVFALEFNFSGDREEIVKRAVFKALEIIHREIF